MSLQEGCKLQYCISPNISKTVNLRNTNQVYLFCLENIGLQIFAFHQVTAILNQISCLVDALWQLQLILRYFIFLLLKSQLISC